MGQRILWNANQDPKTTHLGGEQPRAVCLHAYVGGLCHATGPETVWSRDKIGSRSTVKKGREP